MTQKTGDSKKDSALAKMIIDLAPGDGERVYVIRSPQAGTEDMEKARHRRVMYGIEFTDGIGITRDVDLAAQIKAEFPDYIVTEA